MILEDLIAEVGDAGRFQYIFTTVIQSMEIVIAWSMLQTAIVGATPDWWCVDPAAFGTENMTLDNTTFQQCPSDVVTLTPEGQGHTNGNGTPEVVTCVHYFDPSLVSIVSEWDLVCERKYVKAVINSVQMTGVLVGALAAGQSSDSIGRRITFYVSMALHALTCLVAGFSTTWEMYAVFRFFVGAAIGSYLVLHYVYIMEFVRFTWRPYLASIPSWAVGAGVMCLIAWLMPNWRYLHYMNAAATFPCLLAWFISPESIRWLAAKDRFEEADRVLHQIAKVNRRHKVTDTSERLTLLAREEQGHAEHKYTYHLLFSGWRMVLKTSILAFTWAAVSMSFYGILFGVSALSGNVYLNFFLFSVLEIPLTMVTASITNCIGRRWTNCIYFFVASLTSFGILIADRKAPEDEKERIITGVAICSNIFVSGSWTAIQTFTIELYPTVIRSLGSGFANTAARVGGILAPIVLQMETTEDTVKCYVIVGVTMAVSGLLVLLLVETKGKTLADTLHQDQREINETRTAEI